MTARHAPPERLGARANQAGVADQGQVGGQWRSKRRNGDLGADPGRLTGRDREAGAHEMARQR